MPEQDRKPSRPWQEIAAEVAKEKDSKRTLELVAELNDALDSQPLSNNEERCQGSIVGTTGRSSA
jgi:hypothetical protein